MLFFDCRKTAIVNKKGIRGTTRKNNLETRDAWMDECRKKIALT